MRTSTQTNRSMTRLLGDCSYRRARMEDEDSRRRCNVGQMLVLSNPPAVVIENDRSTDIGA